MLSLLLGLLLVVEQATEGAKLLEHAEQVP